MQYLMVTRWLCVLILLAKSVSAGDSLRVIAQITPEQNVRTFYVDALDQLYVLTKQHELVKYDMAGKWIGNHRNQVLGPLRQVDVSNPLQLMAFYPESGVMLQLDNMLYTTNRFEPGKLGLSEDALMCRSFDNNFWLYDARAFKLRKLAKDLRVVVEGEWLQNKLQYELSPEELVEVDERLYMNDPKHGILVFDLYGAYLKTLPLTGQKRIAVYQGGLYFTRESRIYRYDLLTLEQKELNLPARIKPIQLQYNRSGLWVFDGESVFLLAP